MINKPFNSNIMKNLFIIITLLLGSFTFAQKKTTTKPIVKPAPLESPKVNYPKEAVDKCYIYTAEEKKDNLVQKTETLMEYGGSSIRARIIVTKTNYDPAEKIKADKEGYIYTQPSTIQFIEGKYNLENNTLHFTPDKADKFEKRTFKLVNKPKSKTLDYMKDENNNILKEGSCKEPVISL